MRLGSAATSVCACLLAVFDVAAQEPPPPISKDFFAGRRQALMTSIKELSKPGEVHVVVMRGARQRPDLATNHQDHDFYYLTGVTEPDAAMMLWPATGKEELLVLPYSPFTATWNGIRLAPGDAAARETGFAAVGNSAGLHRRLRALAAEDGGTLVIWTELQPQPNVTATGASAAEYAKKQERDRFDGRVTREQAFADRLDELLGGPRIEDVGLLIGRLRAVKTDEELRQIRAATLIATEGLAEAMKSTRPGVFEYQIAAAARYVFSRLGAGPDAYSAIVGSGPNGCILHYNRNDRRVEDGDLIVMDYGPTVNGYCTDVTRTFPANGKFTPAQRELVSDVAEVQRELIDRIKPGARLSALSALCGQLLREKGYRVDHGPCHHVGLAVHDKEGDVLRPGMVITVEPGAYLRGEGMGCRIEDVVLVTETGCEVLSGHLAASPDAIEELMAGEGIQQRNVGLTGK